jgi:hypothetical protein
LIAAYVPNAFIAIRVSATRSLSRLPAIDATATEMPTH